MPESHHSEDQVGRGAADFRTTHWSMVVAAGRGESVDAAIALEKLCQRYWQPVYAFVRRRGHAPHEAEDLTQGFFERLLAKGYLERADQEKGRFRTFLITLLTRYMANEWDRTRRLKRGGGVAILSMQAGEAEECAAIEPAIDRTPETEYERRWAEILLAHVVEKLAAEYESAGLGERFKVLKTFLVDLKGAMPLGEAADQLGLSQAATKSAVHRMRLRYREVLRDEVAQTVSDPGSIDAELRHLIAALSA